MLVTEKASGQVKRVTGGAVTGVVLDLPVNSSSERGCWASRCTRIAETPEEARARLLHLPGFRLRDPEFSWKHVVPPAALGFIHGDGLGKAYDGDLIVGSAVARPPTRAASIGSG